MKITIKVTKEILERSMMCGVPYITQKLIKNNEEVPSVVENCAIALAVREIFPNAQVYHNTISTGLGTSEGLPKKATQFILAFDHKSRDPRSRLLMKEVSFDLQISDETIEKLNISEVYKVLSESRTLEMVM